MMVNEQRWECGYCGDCFTEKLVLWEPSPQKCMKCGETQLLRKLKNKGPMGTNPFGYPTDKDETRKVSHDYED